MDPRSSMNVPTAESHQQISSSGESQDRPSDNQSSSVQFSPIFVEYQLMKEFVLFQKQKIPHVYVVPSHSSAFDWFGILFIHRGLYSGQIMRFTVHISPTYPNCDLPKLIFDPIPVHPLVDELSGELNTSHRFNKWNSTYNFIFEVIQYASAVMHITTIEELHRLCATDQISKFNWPNDTASLRTAIAQKMETFNQLVLHKMVDDKHYINFTDPGNPVLMDSLKRKLLTGEMKSVENPKSSSINQRQPFNGISSIHTSSPSISGFSWTKKIVFNK